MSEARLRVSSNEPPSSALSSNLSLLSLIRLESSSPSLMAEGYLICCSLTRLVFFFLLEGRQQWRCARGVTVQTSLRYCVELSLTRPC